MIKRNQWFTYPNTLDWPAPIRFSGRLERLKSALLGRVGSWDVFDLALSMTLIVLMLYSSSYWYVRKPINIVAMAAILYPPLRRSKTFWLILLAIVVMSNILNWYRVDNHQYLLTYWCLAIYCSLLTANPARTLALNARWLIGLTFLFAALWKGIFSGDYLDGAFFHHALLLDHRFEGVAAFFGGLADEVFLSNHQLQDKLRAYSSTLQVVQLQGTPQIVWLAQFLTWWTIVTEALIALAFLWPEEQGPSRWRDWSLLLFLLTTYLVAPVVGFGCTLAAMGLVQSGPTFKLTRLFYVGALFVIQIAYFISTLS